MSKLCLTKCFDNYAINIKNKACYSTHFGMTTGSNIVNMLHVTPQLHLQQL